MKQYDHAGIEKKWQKFWDKNKSFAAEDLSDKPKYYLLIEFPYPSGDGLHVGHPRSYTALDIIARKKRMEGYNVLYPIGFDAFGLPTENYAIKTGIHPLTVTQRNIGTFTRQLKALGFSFDWDRRVNTTDPDYYKWTQWIFLKLLEKGLAYKASIPINWCLDCRIGLANEEVVGGVCERCGGKVEKRLKEQWMLKITAYSQRLIDDLEAVDYLEKISKHQINWIGRSEGAEVHFKIPGLDYTLNVYTTRPDTLFGATYMVLAPEHELVEKITTPEHRTRVKAYVKTAMQKSDLERSEAAKEKTGVFTGGTALNPATGKPIPVWVADYVLISYGTGAIMAVPGHDQRDWEFARTHGLPVVEVIKGGDISKEAYTGDGELVNSGFLNGKSVPDAIKAMNRWLKEKRLGGPAVQYKLRDWVFSRQRYWGEPIPVVHCGQCGTVPVPESELPVELPEVNRYEPTESGESPLAAIHDWVHTECPSCGGPARRETDTMPNWAGSSWYFLRYCDPHNDRALADYKKLEYWMPVDLYNGGMEHTTLHLLYSRFWNKFLFDCGLVPVSEPYARRTSHGMILGEGGEKMSKSKGNVVNPDAVVAEYGADVFRCYEMFIGPFDQTAVWDTRSIEGIHRFLMRIWRLIIGGNTGKISPRVKDVDPDHETLALLHKTIKMVGGHIDDMRFNTALSQMMIFVNEINKKETVPLRAIKDFILIFSPFAPHMGEELWERLGGSPSTLEQSWPGFDPGHLIEKTLTIVVQVNGKVRADMEVPADIDPEDLKRRAREVPNVARHLEGKTIRKIIVVPKKLVNIVAG